METVGPLDPDDELWADLEWIIRNGVDITPADVGPWAVRFLDTADAAAVSSLGIYSSVAFMESHGLFIPQLQSRKLWLTAYDGVDPVVPEGWTVVIRQTSGSGSVVGISGTVDTDTAVL